MSINILRRIVIKARERPVVNLAALFSFRVYNTLTLTKKDEISLAHKATMEATQ